MYCAECTFKIIHFLILKVTIGTGCLSYIYSLKYGGIFDCNMHQYMVGGCGATIVLILMIITGVCKYKKLKEKTATSQKQATRGQGSLDAVLPPIRSVYPGMPESRVCHNFYKFHPLHC